ncbi:histidine phosphatase family protein [Chelatococcus sp. GCM10030263]|uniref:histidine phosphatase family protein n=1 Tax=Chelatococcus sp. GCM10030263 TaxID=3273387 RepID=UPI00362258C6
MTVFLLVRHAAQDDVGRVLAGRMPGVHLGPAGRAQAAALGDRLKREPIHAIHTSPRERTRETADAIASAAGLPEPIIVEALDEIDFGAWSGQSFDALNDDPDFRRWNATRSLARTPGGESMLDVQRRVLAHMERASAEAGERTIVLVSHADVIKAIVAHVLGLSVDAWWRFEISPASVTRLVMADWGAKLVQLNETVP